MIGIAGRLQTGMPGRIDRNTHAVPIDILRNKLGWPIEDEDVVYFASEKPKKRIISSYFLPEKIIKKFKKMRGVL
jgi:hypothetical protein